MSYNYNGEEVIITITQKYFNKCNGKEVITVKIFEEV